MAKPVFNQAELDHISVRLAHDTTDTESLDRELYCRKRSQQRRQGRTFNAYADWQEFSSTVVGFNAFQTGQQTSAQCGKSNGKCVLSAFSSIFGKGAPGALKDVMKATDRTVIHCSTCASVGAASELKKNNETLRNLV